MYDAFWNNIHNTNLLALDVILNTLQKMNGQDLKVSGTFCEIVYNEMHENLLWFVFFDNGTEDTSSHSNICTCNFIVMARF